MKTHSNQKHNTLSNMNEHVGFEINPNTTLCNDKEIIVLNHQKQSKTNGEDKK